MLLALHMKEHGIASLQALSLTSQSQLKILRTRLESTFAIG